MEPTFVVTDSDISVVQQETSEINKDFMKPSITLKTTEWDDSNGTFIDRFHISSSESDMTNISSSNFLE